MSVGPPYHGREQDGKDESRLKSMDDSGYPALSRARGTLAAVWRQQGRATKHLTFLPFVVLALKATTLLLEYSRVLIVSYVFSLLISEFFTMLRPSLHMLESNLLRGSYPLRRTTCKSATLRACTIPSLRASKLPIPSQPQQKRSYAVAAEESNKGVVSKPTGENTEGLKLTRELVGP